MLIPPPPPVYKKCFEMDCSVLIMKLIFNEIAAMLCEVCAEVYFQQNDQGQIRRQVRGLPVGGKCSAELANLYCYAVEAEFIDH